MPTQQHQCNVLSILMTVPFLHWNGLARRSMLAEQWTCSPRPVQLIHIGLLMLAWDRQGENIMPPNINCKFLWKIQCYSVYSAYSLVVCRFVETQDCYVNTHSVSTFRPYCCMRSNFVHAKLFLNNVLRFL